MEKIVKLLLSVSCILSTLVMINSPIIEPIEVYASDLTSMNCSANQYEVAYPNKNGTFDYVDCKSKLSDALNVMWGDQNYVVRHSSSKSPMKIIAMNQNGGMAISYPERSSNTTTLTITQDHASANKKNTYVTHHREMLYSNTEYFNTDGTGSVRVTITGFEGLTQLKDVDLVPWNFIEAGVVVQLGGNATNGETVFSVKTSQSHYKVIQNGNNKELVFNYYSGWADNKAGSTTPAAYSSTIGIAADWMSVGSTYYSPNGYDFYSARRCLKDSYVGTFYNYYQFLPARTQSKVSAGEFNNFLINKMGSGTNSKMKDQGQTFINAQNTYGVNALLVYSLACLESAYGTSNFAMDRNNLFGWNAFDSAPGEASWYGSIADAVNQHMGLNLRGYLDINDWRFFGSHVGNKGSGFNVKYAADPYWGYKIASIAYSIDKSSGFKDYNTYSVGIANQFVEVKKSVNGATLYNTRYGETYQVNHTMIILEENNGWVKIQSTNPLSSGNLVTLSNTGGLVNYDWNSSVGYLPVGQIVKVNTGIGAPSNEGTIPTGDHINEINKFAMNGSTLTIEGKSYRPGIYSTSDNQVTHVLNIYNKFFEITPINMTTNISDKDKASFTTTVDLSKLSLGNYYFEIATNYSKLSEYNQVFNLSSSTVTLPQKAEIDGRIYEFINLDGVVFVNITASSTVNPDPKPSEDPDEKPITPKSFLYQVVNLIETKEKTEPISTIHIQGKAFISLMDAKPSDNISHTVSLVSMSTGSKIDFPATTSDVSKPMNWYDGFDYSRIQYDVDINLNDIPEDDYIVQITVKNGDKEETTTIYSTIEEIPKNIVENNGLRTSIKTNSRSAYRLEISANRSLVDMSLINKPTRRASIMGIYSLSINEKEQLVMNAYSYIGNVYMNAENNPKVSFIFEKNDGSNTTIMSATMKACKTDFAAINKTPYTVKNACFDFSESLASLEEGKYIIYVDVEATNTVDGKEVTYKDIFEAYNVSGKESVFTINNRIYTISWSNTRSRMELSITKLTQ
ncbi:glucosaminidase domain-containing protein [Anaerorhabdus sp.]|uniref:glucosaminidase domain-containing protein n=1 Tax=Anaerorhabdus sp. TaxID=1872524 RepID=UPI002FCB86B4